MYRAHFGLRDIPFSNTPDTSFFFHHESYQEALNTLLFGIRTGEPFMKVVGDVGTGKTLLCHKFIEMIDTQKFTVIYIPNSDITPLVLLTAIADNLGIQNIPDTTQYELMRRLSKSIMSSSRKKNIIICIDEAQAISTECLELLRQLSNLDIDKTRILHVVLVGQLSLDDKLNSPDTKLLKQRISYSCILEPLSLYDIAAYLGHRLNVAGYSSQQLFSNNTIHQLHRASNGAPRLINTLAHKAMLAAFGQGCDEVTSEHVKLAVGDTFPAKSSFFQRYRSPITIYCALVLALFLSTGAYLMGRFT